MQASSIPAKIPVPFAASQVGTSLFNVIPATTTTTGDASWQNGFTAANATPLASGGIPPRIQDENGLNNILSAWAQWFSAGGPIYYDPTFQATIGGYPEGALVKAPLSAGTPQVFYLCLVDNNTSNPSTGGAGWMAVQLPNLTAGAAREVLFFASANFTVPAAVTTIFYSGTGGGGGGGSCTATGHAGGAGGGGAAAIGAASFSTTPGHVLQIAIAAGGLGGTAAGAAATAGGTTTIIDLTTSTTIVSLAGGAPGANGTSSANTAPGSYGGNGGLAGQLGGYLSAASLSIGGSGGGTLFGAGGAAGIGYATGMPASGFGAGGGGGAASAAGANGASGFIRMYW